MKFVSHFGNIWRGGSVVIISRGLSLYQQAGARPVGRCDMLPLGQLKITDYHKTKYFRWWNVFDDMCWMGRWSVWSWFDVNRPSFDEDICEWPWPLTFRPQFSSPSYSCPALCFDQIRSFYGFPVSRESGARDGRRDRQMDRAQYIMRPPGGGVAW